MSRQRANSAELDEQPQEQLSAELDESPEKVPPKAWVTLVGFALFVIAFGTCAATYMFN